MLWAYTLEATNCCYHLHSWHKISTNVLPQHAWKWLWIVCISITTSLCTSLCTNWNQLYTTTLALHSCTCLTVTKKVISVLLWYKEEDCSALRMKKVSVILLMQTIWSNKDDSMWQLHTVLMHRQWLTMPECIWMSTDAMWCRKSGFWFLFRTTYANWYVSIVLVCV